MHSKLATIAAFVAAVKAQSACTLQSEDKPSLSWSTCESGGTCTTNSGLVVIDANWRWTHDVDSSTNCYTGNTWDSTYCPDDVTCAENCCLDGAGSYEDTYGVTTSDDALTLAYVTESTQANYGSRNYLMSSDTEYEMFTLLGNEFTFDVDVSNLPCGLNGALYFVSMPEDGGTSEYSGNTAGAEYGTGYCDSQCPRDLKYINGEANVEGWVASTVDSNTGTGDHGSCCPEIDIWEANSISTAFTAHPCTNVTQQECEADDCGGTYSSNRYAGECDPDGCDFNSYRMGDTTFFGSGATVDTDSVITVVTQFIESDGALSEIKRFYVQDGVLIPNSESTISGVSGNSLTSDYCTAENTAFDGEGSFAAAGGWSAVSDAVANPMVLVLSLWADDYADMLWLDSTYPVGSDTAGAVRGSCATTSGVPATLEADSPDSSVTFSAIKFGPINSTFTATTASTNNKVVDRLQAASASVSIPVASASSSAAVTATSSAAATSTGTGTVAEYYQCGGENWTGATECAAGLTCTYQNAFYSQCL